MLSINSALFIHWAIFIVVVLVCAPLLIKPTLALLDERNEKIGGAKTKARSLQEETDSMVKKIEEELQNTRRKALEERERARAEYVAQSEKMIAEARQSAQEKIAEMKKRIASEREDARKKLIADAQAISREIAQRVLGREVA